MSRSSSPATAQEERRRSPAYLGPTSSTFGIEIVHAELERIQAHKIIQLEEQGVGSSPVPIYEDSETSQQFGGHEVLEKVEAFRLIELYEESTGTVYPCVDIGAVKDLVLKIIGESSDPAWFSRKNPSVTFDRDLEILRVILAIGYAIEDGGQTGPGARLIKRVENSISQRFKIVEVDTKELLLLYLILGFTLQHDVCD
jgi:hypothetical protein